MPKSSDDEKVAVWGKWRKVCKPDYISIDEELEDSVKGKGHKACVADKKEYEITLHSFMQSEMDDCVSWILDSGASNHIRGLSDIVTLKKSVKMCVARKFSWK